MAAGIAAIKDNGYYMANCRKIEENREFTTDALRRLGFEVLDSKANFVFAKSDEIGGEELYLKLKSRGILVRHFTNEKIKEYNRITIGTLDDMKALIEAVEEILRGKK
jgi:histidinol-phosphate aminotransferase